VIFIILLWVILAIVLGIKAAINGRSFGLWFVMGIVLDPILAWILYAIVARGK